MFGTTHQQRFKLILNAFEHELHMLGFKGNEGLNQPYRIDIERVSKRDLKSQAFRDATSLPQSSQVQP
ncbi:hypothetical protein [Pseudomonas sp.]|uniref:hypothetical protein n=1 Tax=Pseudomonas sp. TaxID=306 RepID=UPI003F9CC7F9